MQAATRIDFLPPATATARPVRPARPAPATATPTATEFSRFKTSRLQDFKTSRLQDFKTLEKF